MDKTEIKYLLLLIVVFVAACIETDIYLPAFTDMMAYFAVSEEAIQRLLTWNFVGICLSGPFYGPLSDAFGRRKPLLIALGLFLAGSVITLFAHDFGWMLWGRLLQGLGSGGCFTLGTAIIFDAFQGERAIRAVTQLNTIFPFIIAGAPLAGGYLNLTFGFRSNFLAISLLVFISFAICFFFLKETLDVDKRVAFQMGKVLKSFKQVLTSLPFWQLTSLISLLFSAYIAFLSVASVLFVLELGVTKEQLPFYQVALLGAWLVASLTSSRALARWGIATIKRIGACCLLIGGGGFAFIAANWPEQTVAFTAAMTLFTFGVNWVQGLYFPESMALYPEIKGIAASLLTSIRLLITAAVVGLTSQFYDGTLTPLVWMVAGITTITLLTIVLYERKKALTLCALPTPLP
jgi:MFS transporter, DHA1 family, multidrug resistance protein